MKPKDEDLFSRPPQRLSVIDASQPIVAVGYDPETRTMDIKFRTGTIGRHLHVDQKLYRMFIQSPSLGGFYNKYLKGNAAYPYRQLS